MRRYEQVMRVIERQIRLGHRRPGDRLPSVRALSESTGFSVMTVYHAYGELEAAGLIAGRPRSGFHVLSTPDSARVAPDDEEVQEARDVSLEDLSFYVLSDWNSEQPSAFGAAYPSADLFPFEKLSRHVRSALRQGHSAISGEHSEGDRELRQLIAARQALTGCPVDASDLVLTAGGMQGFNLCVTAVTKPGDTVIVEEPTFYPMLLALHQHGLRVVTVKNRAGEGVDPEEFGTLLKQHDITAAVLMPRNHYPNGSHYSSEAAEQIVACAARDDIPIIENDAYGELFYGAKPPAMLKKFDEAGLVLQVGSLSSALAPGYGVGWVIPGRTRTRIAELRFYGAMISGGLMQRAVSNYLKHEPFERHLRRLRRDLESRMDRGLELLADCFEFEYAARKPQGGFLCWIEGPDELDTMELARKAIGAGTSIVPGSLGSERQRFKNCLVLNFSYPWSGDAEAHLRRIGELARESL